MIEQQTLNGKVLGSIPHGLSSCVLEQDTELPTVLANTQKALTPTFLKNY